MTWDGLPSNPEKSGWHFVRYHHTVEYTYPHGDRVSRASQYDAEFWDSTLQVWAIDGWEPWGMKADEMAGFAKYSEPIPTPVILVYSEPIPTPVIPVLP